ncbi:MAG: N-acetylmuramic acid 6-phosphate etherase [Verrucomicrobiota bacterium]|nr:N-acetylmuramic acid 6-phosphate etherase [Verrucomicrobiota bacterium]
MSGPIDSTSNAEKRVLGVDGGGTKTEWTLLDGDGSQLASGVLPAANLQLITDEALEQMFRVLPDATHVGVFLAGCGSDADRERLHAVVQSRWLVAEMVIGSDRASGFATAFAERDGITVIAGTGSAVTGRRGEKIEKAGGWGQLLGDKGGGYNLAVQALRRVLSDYDIDQREGELSQSILRRLCLNKLEDLVAWASTADKMSVAMLAPVVFEAAAQGHKEMLSAIHGGAQTLAEFTAAVAKRLGLAHPEVKLMGGLFIHHPEYGAMFRDSLGKILPGAGVGVCSLTGSLGAAWLASRGLPNAWTGAQELSDVRDSSAELAVATTEQRNPRSARLDQLSNSDLVDLFVNEEAFVHQALAMARTQLVSAVDLASAALQNGGRLFYVGAGTSGRLGVLDASEIPPTFGASPHLVQGIIAGGVSALHSSVEGAEDQPEAGALAVAERGVTAGDVVCGITASGRTPFVLRALQRAAELEATTILLTCNPERRRAPDERYDVTIDLPTGAEIVTGSTRLKAGTATKVALNIISTCSMIRLGKVRGNLMVDVNATNEKLRDRAARLVSEVRGCSYEEARELLERSNWNVRAAIAK